MTSKKLLFSAALSAVLMVQLGGCFFTLGSSAPLLKTEAADFPFVKMVLEEEGGGERFTLAREGESYAFVRGRPEESPTVLVKRAADDTFVVQMTSTTNPFGTISYAVVRDRQNEIEIFYC